MPQERRGPVLCIFLASPRNRHRPCGSAWIAGTSPRLSGSRSSVVTAFKGSTSGPQYRSSSPAAAPHPDPLPASGEREGPAQREGEGHRGRISADLVGG